MNVTEAKHYLNIVWFIQIPPKCGINCVQCQILLMLEDETVNVLSKNMQCIIFSAF